MHSAHRQEESDFQPPEVYSVNIVVLFIAQNDWQTSVFTYNANDDDKILKQKNSLPL